MNGMRWTRRRITGAALLLALMLFGGVVGAQVPPAGPSKRLPRPYEGAPPLVPHDVEARNGLCQECHATGAAGAPLTPHPTRTHFCIQCHVGQDPAVRPFEEAGSK
jgi:nitrate reductase cytochrome c-type subunit